MLFHSLRLQIKSRSTKKSYVDLDSRRKFIYLWFCPFTIGSLVGDQAVEVHRGELANNKKHNVFNIRYVKRYYPFESQFHFVPPATLKDLRKNPSQISRIVDVLRENEKTIFLVLIYNATEMDLVNNWGGRFQNTVSSENIRLFVE